MPYVESWDGTRVWQPDFASGETAMPGSLTSAEQQKRNTAQRSADTSQQLSFYGNPTGFENVWGGVGGHGVDSPTNFGFGNFQHLNDQYGQAAGNSLWNATGDAPGNDFASYAFRPDLPHVGKGGGFYQTNASQMYDWFKQNAPDGLQDPEVWNYLNAMDAATKSAGYHDANYKAKKAKRSAITSGIGLGVGLGPIAGMAGAAGGAALGGFAGYGTSGGDWRAGLKGAAVGGLGALAGGAASQFAGGGIGGKILGGLASGAVKQGAGMLLSNPRTSGAATAPQGSAGGVSAPQNDLGADVLAPSVDTVQNQGAGQPQLSPIGAAVTSGGMVSRPAPRMIRLASGFRRGY